MAATETSKRHARTLGTITALALSLPGVMPAHAEEAPTKGQFGLKYLRYQDGQKNETKYSSYDGTEGDKLDRIKVSAPSMYVLVPFMQHWSIEGSGVLDQVSGASPRYYTDVSGATKSPGGMHDRRKAGDFKLTHYLDRGAIALGGSYSKEHDYRSAAFSVEGRMSSEDNNTTWNIGLGGSTDLINPVNNKVENEHKQTREISVGVTQAMTMQDLAQLSLSYTAGRGYYNDPYKSFDKRPRERNSFVGLLRWNHHFASVGGTLRSSYRYYSDSYKVHAHTIETAWVQPVTPTITLTPSFRYYTQSAASFYYDPVEDEDVYPGPASKATYSSADQRLSAFGGFTLGLKAELRLGDWTTDIKLERYRQEARWRLGGKGSPSIDPFYANILQMGVATRF